MLTRHKPSDNGMAETSKAATTVDRKQSAQYKDAKSRQDLSLGAHVLRIRRGAATMIHPKTVKLRDRQESVVSTTQRGGSKTTTHTEQNLIAARINQASGSTWRTARDVQNVTTSRHSSGPDSTSHTREPNSDNEQGGQSGTEQTSSRESSQLRDKQLQDLTDALMRATEENDTLRTESAARQRQQQSDADKYKALETAYDQQRSQRLDDKAKHDAACEAREVAMTRARKLKARMANKDKQSQKLQENQQVAIAVLNDIHQKALAGKDAGLQEATARLEDVEKKKQQITRKAKDDIRIVQTKAREAYSQLLQNTTRGRARHKAENDGLKSKIAHMQADFDDTNSENKNTILRVTERDAQSEKKLRAMSQMLLQTHPSVEGLKEIVEQNKILIRDNKELHESVNYGKLQIDLLLKKIQQTAGHFTRHQQAEQDARSNANCFQRQAQALEEKALQHKQQLRDAVNQIEELQQGSASAGKHCAALDLLEQEIENLHKRLQTMQQEHDSLQTRFNGLDDKNLTMSFEKETIEAALINTKEQLELSQRKSVDDMRELEFFRNLTRQGDGPVISCEKVKELLANLSQATDENKRLMEDNAKLTQEEKRLNSWVSNIEDKHESEIMKLQKALDDMTVSYYDNLETMEHVRAESEALKAEKGGQQVVKQSPPPNSRLSDFNALRYAQAVGVIPSNIPTADLPTGHSAVYEALAYTRPYGCVALQDAGMVWQRPLFVPFSEREAAKIVQQQAKGVQPGEKEPKIHHTALKEIESRKKPTQMIGAPPGMAGNVVTKTNTVSNNNSVQPNFNNEISHFKSRLPVARMGLNRSKGAPAPGKQFGKGAMKRTEIAPSKVDKVWAMKGTVAKAAHARAKEVVAAKATPKPRAAHPPVPAYQAPQAPPYCSFWLRKYNVSEENYNELDAGLKVDWIKAFIAPEDR